MPLAVIEEEAAAVQSVESQQVEQVRQSLTMLSVVSSSLCLLRPHADACLLAIHQRNGELVLVALTRLRLNI